MNYKGSLTTAYVSLKMVNVPGNNHVFQDHKKSLPQLESTQPHFQVCCIFHTLMETKLHSFFVSVVWHQQLPPHSPSHPPHLPQQNTALDSMSGEAQQPCEIYKKCFLVQTRLFQCIHVFFFKISLQNSKY